MTHRYRADIDGLRAIAVLSVLIYHAGINAFSGGYIGVDVFFVISGYLITGIIAREIENNDFSIARFYERRIRRIYPALFATLLFAGVAAAILYDAYTLKAFSQSALAATFFFSNIHFWTISGYFEGDALVKPLLHTWSLAVEEQYYIVFPLLMFLLARAFKSRMPQILAAIAAISFGWSVYVVSVNPTDAFYLPHLRAWELLAGGLLVYKPAWIKVNEFLRNVLGLLGLGMIAAPVFLYSSSTPFPGAAAAVPVIGTALVIYSGTESPTLVSKLLGIRPMTFIGQISYSLYLWHWVIIQFAKYYAIRKLTRPELAVTIVIVFIVSIASWKFIEQPFRKARQKRSRVFASAAGAMAVTAVLGFIIYINNGFPNRPYADLSYEEKDPYTACNFYKANSPLDNIPFCILGAKDSQPSFLVWGDSHAAALAPGIASQAAQQEVAGLLTFNPVICPPLMGITAGRKSSCFSYNNAMMEYIELHTELKTIFLAARWANNAEGVGYKENMKIKFWDVLSESPHAGIPFILFEKGLNRTVEQLLALDRKVVIVSQVPEVKYDVPPAFSIARRTGRDVNQIISPTVDEYFARNEKVFLVINAVHKQHPEVQIVNPWEVLCNERQCPVTVDNTPIYMDANHLSNFGSNYISDLFEPFMAELAKSK